MNQIRRSVVGSILYALAGLAIGYWMAISLWPRQPYYRTPAEHTRLLAGFGGAAVYGIAGIVSCFRFRYGRTLGLLAAVFCWITLTFPWLSLREGFRWMILDITWCMTLFAGRSWRFLPLVWLLLTRLPQ